MTTGQRFKQVLEDLGLTNNGFAVKIGVSSTVINGIVNDTNKPGSKVLMAMKEVFPQYNSDWILNGDGYMKKAVSEPGDYLQEHLRKLEESFQRLSQQIEVKDQQIAAKDRQIEMLISQLGKPECDTETGVYKHPATEELEKKVTVKRA